MSPSKVLVIGGTGGQGVPIVEELAQHGFEVVVLTRDDNSPNAKKLSALKNVKLSIGSADDEVALHKVFKGIDYAFVNLSSWAYGIKGEMYLGIRIFEIAVQSGVKHYIWSSLDNISIETRFDDSFRAGHYRGKGIVEQWMLAVPQTPMRWTVMNTGPYIEQLWYFQKPEKTNDGVYNFRLPLDQGAVPFVCLDDVGYYVRWIFDHPEESAGLSLGVSVEHVTLDQLASTFTEVTGKPAKATNMSIEKWFDICAMDTERNHKMGSSKSHPDDPSLLTVYQNFSNWWRLYQASGNNTGLLRRDYALLDRIHPQRTKSLKQWMERVGYDGEKAFVVEATAPWSG